MDDYDRDEITLGFDTEFSFKEEESTCDEILALERCFEEVRDENGRWKAD